MTRVVGPRPEIARLVAYDVPPPDVPVILSANESPYNLPEGVLGRVREIVDELAFNRYPDPTAGRLRQAIGARFALPSDHVLVGNGGDELLLDLLLAYGGPGRLCLSFPPSFSMYPIVCEVTGTNIFEIKRDPQTFDVPIERAIDTLSSGSYSVAILCTPNNPTGTAMPRVDIARFVEGTNAVVLVDEAYGEFGGESAVGLVRSTPNLIVMRTFSKAFSLAGLRVGYILGQPETLAAIAKVKLPYNADAFSQAVALAVLQDVAPFEERWEQARAERQRLSSALASKSNTIVYPSQANFLCVRVRDAKGLLEALAAAGILVRDVGADMNLSGCVRVTVGSPDENDAVIAAWPG